MSSLYFNLNALWHRQLRRRAWLRRLLGCSFLFFLAKGLVWSAILGWLAIRGF